jgi:hypothetical protein
MRKEPAKYHIAELSPENKASMSSQVPPPSLCHAIIVKGCQGYLSINRNICQCKVLLTLSKPIDWFITRKCRKPHFGMSYGKAKVVVWLLFVRFWCLKVGLLYKRLLRCVLVWFTGMDLCMVWCVYG